MRLDDLLTESLGNWRRAGIIAGIVAALSLGGFLSPFQATRTTNYSDNTPAPIEVVEEAKDVVKKLDTNLSAKIQTLDGETLEKAKDTLKEFGNEKKKEFNEFIKKHPESKEKIINGAKKYYREIMGKIDKLKIKKPSDEENIQGIDPSLKDADNEITKNPDRSKYFK